MDKQVQPWHIYTGIFVAFWTLTALFDNFFFTAILCVGCGFGCDTFRKYLGEEASHDRAEKSVKTSLEPVQTSLEPVEDVFVAPTKPLPPEPESEPENEIETSSKAEIEEEEAKNEIEEEITADYQPEVSSMKVSENDESAKKSHLEQVDLLSNVPDFESSLQSEDLLEDIEETREDGDEICDNKTSIPDKPADLVEENFVSKRDSSAFEEEYQEQLSPLQYNQEMFEREEDIIQSGNSSEYEVEEKEMKLESSFIAEESMFKSAQEEPVVESKIEDHHQSKVHVEDPTQSSYLEKESLIDPSFSEGNTVEILTSNPFGLEKDDFEELMIRKHQHHIPEDMLSSDDKLEQFNQELMDDFEVEESFKVKEEPVKGEEFLSESLVPIKSRKLEKVFDPNETVEENSSFEDETGSNKVGSDLLASNRRLSSQDLSEPEDNYPIKFSTKEAPIPSAKQPSEDLFDTAKNILTTSEQVPFEDEHLDDPYQQITKMEDKPVDPMPFETPVSYIPETEDKEDTLIPAVKEPSQTSESPVLETKVSPSLEQDPSKTAVKVDAPSPVKVEISKGFTNPELKLSSFEDDDKLSFLLEDAQRDGSDDRSDDSSESQGHDDDDAYSKGHHPALEDEGDPWRAPRREPLDSAGECLSHPDSDELPSRDDVSHRAVFGDDIDEEELLEEIESEEKMETGNGSSSDNDDDSEGPDQVDSDDQDDVELGEIPNHPQPSASGKMESKPDDFLADLDLRMAEEAANSNKVEPIFDRPLERDLLISDIKKMPQATTGQSRLFDSDDETPESSFERQTSESSKPESSFDHQTLDSSKLGSSFERQIIDSSKLESSLERQASESSKPESSSDHRKIDSTFEHQATVSTYESMQVASIKPETHFNTPAPSSVAAEKAFDSTFEKFSSAKEGVNIDAQQQQTSMTGSGLAAKPETPREFDSKAEIDFVVEPEIKFAAVEKMSPNFEEASLMDEDSSISTLTKEGGPLQSDFQQDSKKVKDSEKSLFQET